MQMIFEITFFLDRMPIEDIIGFGMKLHGLATDKDVRIRRGEAILARRSEPTICPVSRMSSPAVESEEIGVPGHWRSNPELRSGDELISAPDVSIQAHFFLQFL